MVEVAATGVYYTSYSSRRITRVGFWYVRMYGTSIVAGLDGSAQCDGVIICVWVFVLRQIDWMMCSLILGWLFGL
jgi:hypothetical protein